MKFDLNKSWNESSKYEKATRWYMSDCKYSLCSLRNRLEALQAVVDKVKQDQTFTSKELGVSPQALAAMRFVEGSTYSRQLAPICVVEQRECFINIYGDKYRKVYYNIYKLRWTKQEVKEFIKGVCDTYGLVLGK